METLANISVVMKKEVKRFLLLFLVLFLVSWELSGYAILEMKSSLLPQGYELIITEPGEYVMARFQVALAMMLLFSIPIMGFFALKIRLIKERAGAIAPWAVAGLVLFVSGFLATYRLILPSALSILSSMAAEGGVNSMFSLSSFVNFSAMALLIFSLSFEFPLIIIWLVTRGIVQRSTLKARRREIYVIVFIVTALITADPTPVSQIMLSLPMIALFEASLVVTGMR
ncbi:MAG: twin-arginine translocase subunit TatC [Candidatus Aenigmarchaeota archaeon]|nr:twin-arginine translocase subunit TatC [Candidatus Aenigmarchaeota archaeon]